jgi:hypothetical protein
MFITFFTTANRLPLSSASIIQSITAHHIYLKSISLPNIHANILQVISFLKLSTPIAPYALPLSSKFVTSLIISSSAIGQSEAFEWKCKSMEVRVIKINLMQH